MAAQNSATNLVGVHYRVGKKIGEGSFGVIFEGTIAPSVLTPAFFLFFFLLTSDMYLTMGITGTNLLNSQTVAIKFVRDVIIVRHGIITHSARMAQCDTNVNRNLESQTRRNYGMSVGRTGYLQDAVSIRPHSIRARRRLNMPPYNLFQRESHRYTTLVRKGSTISSLLTF